MLNPSLKPCWPPNQSERSDRLIWTRRVMKTKMRNKKNLKKMGPILSEREERGTKPSQCIIPKLAQDSGRAEVIVD